MGERNISDEIHSRIKALSPEQRKLFEEKLKQRGIAPDRIPSRSNSALEVCWVSPDSVEEEAPNPPNDFASAEEVALSLFFFSGDGATTQRKKYQLILECAKFADRHGFAAIWTPERHFKPFGGLYPNPSVLSAALAMVTERVQLRAGSVVLPLQNPIRTAEEWSEVDNLCDGRVGVAFASGWHPDDFALAPDVYTQRREAMFRDIQIIKRLWKGETVPVRNGEGEEIDVRIYPNPIQVELPIWITASSRETFIRAGSMGANVLTGLIEHGVEDCAEKIAAYRRALEENGYDRRKGCVTVMLHTYLGEDMLSIKQEVQQPFCSYLRSFLQISERQLTEEDGLKSSLNVLDAADQEALLLYAFERYFETRSLFGTPDVCRRTINRLRQIGVNEVACLLDFGLDTDTILRGLTYLNLLREGLNKQVRVAV